MKNPPRHEKSNRFEIREFNAHRVRPLPGQPRVRFRAIEELAESIRTSGQHTPGIVTLVKDNSAFDAELVDGERRLRACMLAGVPFRAEIRGELSYREKYMISLGANFGRDEHTSTEKAVGLQRAITGGETTESLAKKLGMSATSVQQHLNLFKLHPSVFKMLEEAENSETRSFLNFSTAQNLVNLPHAEQLVFARRIKQGDFRSVEELRRVILQHAQEHGIRVTQKTRSPTSHFAGLRSLVGKTNHRIGVYSDMPFKSLQTIIESASADEFNELLFDLKDVLQKLTGFCEILERRRAAFLRNSNDHSKQREETIQ